MKQCKKLVLLSWNAQSLHYHWRYHSSNTFEIMFADHHVSFLRGWSCSKQHAFDGTTYILRNICWSLSRNPFVPWKATTNVSSFLLMDFSTRWKRFGDIKDIGSSYYSCDCQAPFQCSIRGTGVLFQCIITETRVIIGAIATFFLVDINFQALVLTP